MTTTVLSEEKPKDERGRFTANLSIFLLHLFQTHSSEGRSDYCRCDPGLCALGSVFRALLSLRYAWSS